MIVCKAFKILPEKQGLKLSGMKKERLLQLDAFKILPEKQGLKPFQSCRN